jgi:hypothetical protein
VAELQRNVSAEVEGIEGLDNAVEVGGAKLYAVPNSLGKYLLALKVDRRYGTLVPPGFLSIFFWGGGGYSTTPTSRTQSDQNTLRSAGS